MTVQGNGQYWSYGEREDIAWAYDKPRWDAERVRGRIAFYNERTVIEVG